ncbi:CheR family methyltransferase [Carboxydothermus pertinax]|uniref:protein-glutamate O-methyltransferase n=1 Tax=Carboxydothermus pertinax TaxID=870242 RepID=A0A1L8CUJ4_9THEO|nr:protein-glutamate O-methyltransferase CheR [Carboxydothermus pertinax]GAV22583.1 hypothetical protein cpu_10930 [Carboxydothermus pertinax]
MNFAEFKLQVYKRYGLDLNQYKENQVQRRLTLFLEKSGLGDFNNLLVAMDKDAKMFEKFIDTLTINVTEFFRDPKIFFKLYEKYLPELRGKTSIKIWSAGCSTGAEPYSVAIFLEELGLKNYKLDATDLDENILKAAREGKFGQDALKNVPEPWRIKYFDKIGDQYQVKLNLRRKVNFKQQNLLKDSFDHDYNVILCRNVIIYFTREAQDNLYRKFSDSLVAKGILFIGGSEVIFNPEKYRLMRMEPCYYRKIL